jgi:hypothetical protein
MQVEVLFPDIVPMDPAGERPRSGGDMDDSSLFSNMARRFRTPPDMMTDVAESRTWFGLSVNYGKYLECNGSQRSAQTQRR